MDRIARSTVNKKQDKIRTSNTRPSVNAMRNGQEVLYMENADELVRYRKEEGILWKSIMKRDSVPTEKKSRQLLSFGNQKAITAPAGGSITTDASPHGLPNSYGYLMPRSGKCIGISWYYKINIGTTDGYASATVQLNQVNQDLKTIDNGPLVAATAHGSSSKNDPFIFSEGDQINVEITLHDGTIPLAGAEIEEVMILVEIETKD